MNLLNFFLLQIPNFSLNITITTTTDSAAKVKGNVKVKFTLEQVMKVKMGCRGIAVLFFKPRHKMGVGG